MKERLHGSGRYGKLTTGVGEITIVNLETLDIAQLYINYIQKLIKAEMEDSS